MSLHPVHNAAQVIRQGGVVAFPTETVYGLGASALNPTAVARIFEIKARPSFDPLIVHAASAEEAFALAADVPDVARQLARRFWPGPLTLVLPKKPAVPDITTSGLPSVGLRVPQHPVALALLRDARVPIAAPSANRFGRISPTTAQHVREELGGAPDMILDGGPCTTGVESTVLGIDAGGAVTLLRPGGTPLEDIEAITGPVHRATDEARRPASPGQLPQHYAPRTPLTILSRPDVPPPAGKRVGLLAFTTPAQIHGYDAVEVLSRQGDLREAAANLFAALRRLDASGVEVILAEPAPSEGLGLAINDRLRRATHG